MAEISCGTSLLSAKKINAMQCCGITKNKKRCRNNTRFVFCKIHSWQPVTGFFALISLVGLFAGFFQDLIKPVSDSLTKKSELRKAVAVELKTNRRTAAEWEDNADPTIGKSDVVTILADRQPVKSIEIYHTAKDQRFKNYPPTSALADNFIPTTAEYQIVDLDGDGANEIIIVLKNQLYSLHFDRQVNVLIFNASGELLARTPYPEEPQGLNIKTLNPYSAYRTTVAMQDKISGKIDSSTFSNDFSIVADGNRKKLKFSWVIDSASYASSHLHQVEEFQYEDGKLVSADVPKFYISNSWDDATSGKRIRETQEAVDFLNANNQPEFTEMYRQLEKDSKGKN